MDNDIFGDGNRPLLPTLDTANVFNQSMSKFAKLVSVIRGILEAPTVTKNEDLSKRREIYDYFGVSEEIVQNRADAEKMDAFTGSSLRRSICSSRRTLQTPYSRSGSAACTDFEHGKRSLSPTLTK